MDHLSPPSAAETPPQKTQELPSSSARASHNDDQKKYMHAMENFKALVLKFAVASVPTKSLSFTQRSLIEQKFHQFFPHFHPPDHPAYSWMIQRAIEQLNEEGGSYEKAISEYILREWGDLPWAHVTILAQHLRNLCEKGEIVATPCGRYRLHDVANIIIPYSSPSGCTSSDSFSTFSLSSSCSSGAISSSDTSPRPKKKGWKRKQKKETMKKRVRPLRRECNQALRKGRNRPCWKDSLKEVQIEVPADLGSKERLSIREEPQAMDVKNPTEGTDSKDSQHHPAATTELLMDILAHRQEDEEILELIEQGQVNEKLQAEEEKQLNKELVQERSRRNLGRPRKKWSKKEVVYVSKHAHRCGRKRGRPCKTELSETEMPRSMEKKMEEMSIQDGNREVGKVTGDDLQQQNDQVEEQQLKRQKGQDLGRRRLSRPLKKWSKKEIVYVLNHSRARGRKRGRPRKSNVSEDILENVDDKSKQESNNEEPRGCQYNLAFPEPHQVSAVCELFLSVQH